MSIYTGYEYYTLTNKQLSAFYKYELDSNQFDLFENEYLIITDKKKEVIDYGIKKGDKIKKVPYTKLGDHQTEIIKPRNPEQYCAFHMLKNSEAPVKVLTGKFGTGKSLSCIRAGLQLINEGKFDSITFVRNNVQVRDTDNIGALQGSLENKFLPYLSPFIDHCGDESYVEELTRKHILNVIPLAFLRGRSIRNSIIYSMESENLTKEHIQLIMGRVDKGSELWMDGDIKQRDRQVFENSQGLETMIDRLKGNPLFAYIDLKKNERSGVASLADLLD